MRDGFEKTFFMHSHHTRVMDLKKDQKILDKKRGVLNNYVMGKRGSRKAKPVFEDCSAWQLEYSPVWYTRGNEIIPSPLCLKWWQNLAEKRYGDTQRWLEIAYQLGYVTESINPESGNITYEPYGFEYDGALMRKSLDLSKNGPLVFREISVNSQPYHQLWDKLLKEEMNEGSSNLG